MRICIVYDCIFPWTIGGAERWYRNLAERLASEGHEVTYLTLLQWDPDNPPRLPGVRVTPVGPRLALYDGERRKVWPPVRFGIGVLCHLIRNGQRYDVVHSASFPYFSMLAIGLARPFFGYRVVCDWHEVWRLDYWLEYIGAVGGRIGWLIQRLCAAVPQTAYTFSRLHAERLKRLGLRGEATVLTGEYAGGEAHAFDAQPAEPPEVVYVGRMIPEKRVLLLVDAIAVARSLVPGLRGRLIGKGPQYEHVTARIKELGLEGSVVAPGFVSTQEVEKAMCNALCIVQPSSREGYGMVVVEASARGVPTILVQGDDNAAVELIDAGENGYVAGDATANSIAIEIERCWKQGAELRGRTRGWYDRNAARVSLEGSVLVVAAGYGRAAKEAGPASG